MPDLYLKDKLCKIRGLTKSTSLNGQCAKIIEWIENTGRITVKLKNGREIAVKLSNITIEDLEPVICSFKIRDKMENCLEQSIQLAVPKTKLANEEDIRNIFFMITNMESQIIMTNNFVCSAHDYNCNEKAILWVSTPSFYAAQGERPSRIMDVLCVPICGKPACEAEAKRQTELLIKSTSKMFPGFPNGQRRHCGNCKKMSTKKMNIKNVQNAWLYFIVAKSASGLTGQYIKVTANDGPELYCVIFVVIMLLFYRF